MGKCLMSIQMHGYIHMYVCTHLCVCTIYSEWVQRRLFVHRRVQWAPYPAYTHLCVIMRQTINFQVHLLRFSPGMGVSENKQRGRLCTIGQSLAGQRIQQERYGQRGIYTHTYTDTHTRTHTLMQTYAEYRYLFLYFEKMYFEYFCALKVAAIC